MIGDCANWAAAWHRRSGLTLGATGIRSPALPPALPLAAAPPGYVRLAVAGAHLRGQPLHAELPPRRRGVRPRLPHRPALSLREPDAPQPAAARPGSRGRPRRRRLPSRFTTCRWPASARWWRPWPRPWPSAPSNSRTARSSRAILCESWAAARARDITEFGGWVAFRDHLDQARLDASSWPSQRP